MRDRHLHFVRRDLELGSYLLLGKGEDATGGRFRESITSDALEALIGAIYLDGGFANAKEFILKYYFKRPGRINSSFMIARLSCRKWYRASQEKGIVYQLVGEEGPDHNKILPCRGCDRRRSLWMWYRKNQRRLPNRKRLIRQS